MNKNLSSERKNLKVPTLKAFTKFLSYLDSGEITKAQQSLECLNLQNCDSRVFQAATLNNLSIVYMKQKLQNKALVCLNKALSFSKPKVPIMGQIGTLINLSAAASTIGLHSESITYSIHALNLLSLEPNAKLFVILYYNLGIEYLYSQKPKEAEEILRKALSTLNENHINDSILCQMIVSAINSLLSKRKIIEPYIENSKQKTETQPVYRKKVLKKSQSLLEANLGISAKMKKVEIISKIVKPRTGTHASPRNLTSSRRKLENCAASNTSSTESIKNNSQLLRNSLSSSKSVRKVTVSEKLSHNSTPLSGNNSISMQFNENELGNRIQNIGDHLSNIERKLNDFVELCHPLKILTEDPDEQLDSHRLISSTLILPSEINKHNTNSKLH